MQRPQPAIDPLPTSSGDWRSLYPFTSHFLSVNGHRMHYLDEGPQPGERAADGPLLMVHGNPTWSFYYRQLVMALRPDYRMIAPDHIGCGLSDKPSDYRYTLSQHADNLRQLVEQLDLRDITLLVHDWGGAIGLRVACDMSQRFTRIVLFNTGAFPPPFIPWRIAACRIPVVGRIAVQGANLFARAATHMALHRPSRMSQVAKSGMLAPYDTWSNRRAIYRFVRDIPTTSRHPTWPVLARLEGDLQRLAHLPTCLVWGMRDWCFRPSCLARLRTHFPAAEVHELANVGHWLLEEAPEQVAAIVRSFRAGSAPCPPQPSAIGGIP